MTKPIRAWHFVGDRLRDGGPVPADGEKLVFPGEPILCRQGLHWSRDPYDALQYAAGRTLCLVEIGGTVVEGDDKGASTERTIVARMDASELLCFFARMQALSVIHLYPNKTDDVVFDYLMTGNEELRSAAWSAARSAGWSAAWSTAEAAARSAARSAAWSTAWSTAWPTAAAWSAARSAAEAAARSAAREEFNALVNECFSDFLGD